MTQPSSCIDLPSRSGEAEGQKRTSVLPADMQGPEMETVCGRIDAGCKHNLKAAVSNMGYAAVVIVKVNTTV